MLAAPISISAPAARVVTPLYPGGVVVNPAGLSVVTADPQGNRAGLAARAALVANRRFKAGEREFSHFVVHAYNPRTGDAYIQQETGSSVHRVNRVTGKCDCEDATKGETKRLRMACAEGGVDADDLPVKNEEEPTCLHCKHFWIFCAILRRANETGGNAETLLAKFPADLPRTGKLWALCPSKQTTREAN